MYSNKGYNLFDFYKTFVPTTTIDRVKNNDLRFSKNIKNKSIKV